MPKPWEPSSASPLTLSITRLQAADHQREAGRSCGGSGKCLCRVEAQRGTQDDGRWAGLQQGWAGRGPPGERQRANSKCGNMPGGQQSACRQEKNPLCCCPEEAFHKRAQSPTVPPLPPPPHACGSGLPPAPLQTHRYLSAASKLRSMERCASATQTTCGACRVRRLAALWALASVAGELHFSRRGARQAVAGGTVRAEAAAVAMFVEY